MSFLPQGSHTDSGMCRTGHVEGNDEYMPVEESGNMILMTYAYCTYFRSPSIFFWTKS